jgi:hypothetical protein
MARERQNRISGLREKRDLKMAASEQDVESAEQQFTGFIHATKGYDITSLAKEMGLTADEWGAIKERGILLFTAEQIEELDELFD